MHWLPPASLLLQFGFVLVLACLLIRAEKQAEAALELAKVFLKQRNDLAFWLALEGFEVDLEDGVWIGWPEGDPEEERLAR